ncbi:hypothetical protein ABZ341_34525 [Streptomyces sp. NPDC006173]
MADIVTDCDHETDAIVEEVDEADLDDLGAGDGGHPTYPPYL